MSNKPTSGTIRTKKPAPLDDLGSLRDELNEAQFETDFGVKEFQANEVTEGRLFGLAAGERMILSMILFLAVAVLSIALLLATGTIVLPS